MAGRNERDAKIVTLDQVLADRSHEVDTLKAAIAERDAKIVALDQILADRSHEVDTNKAVIAEQDAKIVALVQVLADRSLALARRSHEVAALKTAMADRENPRSLPFNRRSGRCDCRHRGASLRPCVWRRDCSGGCSAATAPPAVFWYVLGGVTQKVISSVTQMLMQWVAVPAHISPCTAWLK